MEELNSEDLQSDNENVEELNLRDKTEEINNQHYDENNADVDSKEDDDNNNVDHTKNVDMEVVGNADDEGEESENLSKVTIKRNNRFAIVDSDSDEEISTKNSNITDSFNAETSQDYVQKSRLTELCDPESSENEEQPVPELPAKKTKTKTKSTKESVPSKMTAKDANEQRLEIRKASQKMLRESQCSLPYHKPKAHSLKDFLEKRSRLASPFSSTSQNLPPSLAIKMSLEQLEEVTKKLEEREKEVLEFYKSESESEDENSTPPPPEAIGATEETTNLTEITNEKENDSENMLQSLNVDINNKLDLQVNDSDVIINETSNLDQNQEKMEDSNDITDTDTEKCASSIDYIFNLGDIDDNLEDEYDELDKILISSDENTEPQCVNTKKFSKSELLKCVSTLKPSLSGSPTKDIDLVEGIVKENDISKLMERFVKHTTVNQDAHNKTKLDIINLTQGEIHKETVAIPAVTEDETAVIIEKPGVRLKNFRNGLQLQMAQNRSQMWKQKQDLLSVDKKESYEEVAQIDNDADDAILDDEDEEVEEELSDEEIVEDEENEEKRQPKSVFLDDEADETDMDEISQSSQNDEDQNKKIESSNEDDHPSTIKKPLKRILKGFIEDSDDETDQLCLSPHFNDKNKNTDSNNLDASDDDDCIPPNQPRLDKTPHRELSQSKRDLVFHTPITQLTGLQNLNSGSKYLHESPISQFHFPSDDSLDDHNEEVTVKTGPQKKLFSDTYDDNSNSQSNLKEIAQLCSGKFSGISLDECPNNEFSTICTDSLLENTGTACSDSFNIISESTSPRASPQTVNNKNSSNNEAKYLDDDRLISQLLDEEEMEQFKKKFDSPVAPSFGFVGELDLVSKEISSDSSDEEVEEINKTGIKRNKKLVFSDDESSSDVEEDERIDLHNNFSDEDLDSVGDDNVGRVIDYDSEENEVEYIDDEASNSASNLNTKVKDFVENEAELSESDWDSADEDEKGLDFLEAEQGDADVFDENKIRSDLEKIHMRQLLDQDNEEIKVLQELLLEDGELHGTGRQRQFRWKNINNFENENERTIEEVDIFLDEDDTEEQLRRSRHQRELFLKSQQHTKENDEIVLPETDSQVLQLGQEVIRKSNLSEDPQIPLNNSKNTRPLMFTNTRGSFLSRNDQFLTKLAEFTKVSTENVQKNSKNFLFQTKEVEPTTPKGSKRKKKSATPSIIKKLRTTTNTVDVT